MANDDVTSSTTTPAPSFRLRWDVFLSFRGEDTRQTITENLYKSLDENGIRVFKDDNGLARGDEIAPSLIEAIYDSAASIIILSPNYGSSRWCLEELSKICELNRLILPVFYGVDPSHVRRQRGPFEDDFESHELRFEEAQVLKWRNAMAKVGGISGWVFNNRDEQQLIRFLVKRVLNELSNIPMRVAAYTVGLDSRVEEVVKLLDVSSSGVLVLGLHGTGGIGKTTLAKAVYNKLVGRFEYRSFISNVREISAQHGGLISLQRKLINDLSPDNTMVVANEVEANIAAIKKIFHDRKFILVLDDVDDLRQLNALGGKKELFCQGSRIIITTRDRSVLHENNVNKLYEVKNLDSSKALQLFSYHALRREKPTDKFLNLSKQIVSLTGGLPLALEVFGAFLFDKRRIKEWEDAVEKLRKIRPDDLQAVLKISFDGLDEEEKCIFLDIACLFVKMEMKREDAIDILKGCGFRGEIAITVLAAKSLIKITDDDTLWMHDQLRDMGRQIVQQENLLDPGKRSRLWDHDEIVNVFKQQKGTRSIQGIVLDFKKEHKKASNAGTSFRDTLKRWRSFTSAVIYLKERYQKCLLPRSENESEAILCTKHFLSMVSLRLLQINHVKLEGNFKYLPSELKWLQWKGCTMKNLPSDFRLFQLAILDLSESTIEHVWGFYTKKVAKNLTVMNLHGCYNLVAIPDLSAHRFLEKLVLEGCVALTKIHESVGNINTLLHLNLRSCTSLVEFPSDVSGLKHLENLILSGCSKIKELPENIGSMKSLKELHIDGTAIEKLPQSIFQLVQLETLILNRCKCLKQLPKCIGKLVSLKELSLNEAAIEKLPDSIGDLENLEKLSLMWSSVTAIPSSIGNLKSLVEFLINGTVVKELPVSIGSLSYLKTLSVGNCKLLRKLPESIEGLASLVELQLDGTDITDLPDQIGSLKMLDKLEMRNCGSFKTLPVSLGNMLSLTTLTLFKTNITEFPESFGMLESLVILRLNECKKLQKLPSSMGKLKSLVHLLMEGTAVTELPESFGMLSSLMVLKMAKKEAIIQSTEEQSKSVELPTSFSNLCMLEELDARGWRISGNIPDDFEKLSSLEILKLGKNNFCSLPSSLRGLSLLKQLLLPHCEELKSLPPLPSSLEILDVANCFSLESIHDLSNLESLHELNLTNCEKVVDIEGIECLKSLRGLYMSGCNTCSSVIKTRLSKVHLKKLRNLSMPGSKIPDWFSENVVSVSECKNHEIKGLIIGVVISINHQIPNDGRCHVPAVVDIQAEILTQSKPSIRASGLYLLGVPRTNEDQVHLCRYSVFHPLVSMLKDGSKIQVTKRNPPFDRGVELKKCGICLVYENEDDYDGEEESLDESQQSISQKLAHFFGSF